MADRTEKERSSRMLRKAGGGERSSGERHRTDELDDLIEGGTHSERGGGAADRDNDPSR